MRCKLLTRQRPSAKLCVFLIALCMLAVSADFVLAVEGKIAFTSRQDGVSTIYIMDADGGNRYKLTEGGEPAWLPNAEQIGYVYREDIWVIDSNGTNRVNITKGRNDFRIRSPDWSPDGRKIAYSGSRDVFRNILDMDARGNNSQFLTNDNQHDATPSWSPYGNRIAFRKSGQGPKLESDIFVINANGANLMNLTKNPPARNANPSWSPDGKKIAYVAWPKPFLWTPPHNIYVMNSDGTNPIMITEEGPWVYEWQPCWSPDGKKIAFVKHTLDGFEDIFTINADGSGLQNITQTHRVSEWSPAWSPAPLAVSSSGRMVTQWGSVKRSAKSHPTVK